MGSNKAKAFADTKVKGISFAVAAALTLMTASVHAVDFIESTKISATSFIDFSSIDQHTNGGTATANPPGAAAGTPTTGTGNGVDVKRFYLIIDHAFDDMWSANLTTDFNYAATDSETQFFVKKAYLQAKVSDAFIARVGSADMPWIPYVESLYGYRYVENTLIDRTKFGNSADWGAHAGGSFYNNIFSYAFSMVDGAGFKKPVRSRSMDFEGRLSAMPLPGLSFALGFYNGKLGADTGGTPTTVATTVKHTATRVDAVAAYVNPKFRVGLEWFRANNFTAGEVVAIASDSQDGYSGWGSYNFTDKLSAFARYDRVNPNRDQASSLQDKYYNLGLSYNVRKNIDVALVYKHEDVSGGNAANTLNTISTSNGVIGGNLAGAGGDYKEVGMFAQVKF